MNNYCANTKRYTEMSYRYCGKSGLLLPAISLGLWHNFGGIDSLDNSIEIIHTAFDCGVTHFDLANNYGPPPGSAEITFGEILRHGLIQHRDELIISSKAGHDMWSGPYGKGGSRKHLMASIEQSLTRMGIEYVDIFYSHCPDPDTPLEETARALSNMVKEGKALYVGISKYNSAQTLQMIELLQEYKTPCLIHQAKYSMLERSVESELLSTLSEKGVGFIAFSPLAQGILTDRYLHGIPESSRAAKASGYLQKEQITTECIENVHLLNQIAAQRGQSLAEMSLAWLLKDERVSSVIVGASSKQQLLANLNATNNSRFSLEELSAIECILMNK